MAFVIPGRAEHEPGLHNRESGLWVPDLRSRAIRNDIEVELKKAAAPFGPPQPRVVLRYFLL